MVQNKLCTFNRQKLLQFPVSLSNNNHALQTEWLLSNNLIEIKAIGHLNLYHKGIWGAAEVQLHSSFTSTQDGDQWLNLCPDCFTPIYLLNSSTGVLQSSFECFGEQKISFSGIEPWIISPLSIHSENYTIPTSRTISSS
jgi:hypothetical protein